MITLFKVFMPEGVEKDVADVLHSGYVAQGPKVEEFEHLFGRFIGNSRVAAVNSCTSALTLALRAAGVTRGDKVITTPMTCTATNIPILALGAEPVWADVDDTTGLIDPDSVEAMLRVTKGVRAVMAVDWGGMPCDYDRLTSLSLEYGVPIVEDAAHALGAWYMGKRVGTVADYTCFSLQAIKHVTTGDGGVLAVSIDEQLFYAKRLRWFGISREAGKDSHIDQDIREVGYKFHMNDIAASIGVRAIGYAEDVVAAYRENARWIADRLPGYFKVPREVDRVSAWWVLTVLLPSRRDEFIQFMREKGVQVSRVHKRNDVYTVFKRYNDGRVLRGVDEFSRRMVCLPCHWALTEDERLQILYACEEWATK